MRSKAEIEYLLAAKGKDREAALGIKIRNGQCTQGILAALRWVLKGGRQ